jgi:hypothetical protein
MVLAPALCAAAVVGLGRLLRAPLLAVATVLAGHAGLWAVLAALRPGRGSRV